MSTDQLGHEFNKAMHDIHRKVADHYGTLSQSPFEQKHFAVGGLRYVAEGIGRGVGLDDLALWRAMRTFPCWSDLNSISQILREA